MTLRRGNYVGYDLNHTLAHFSVKIQIVDILGF